MCDMKIKWNIAVVVTVCITIKPFVAKATQSILAKRLIGRAKRAPHWGVQSRFRVIYITRKMVPITGRASS